MWNEDEIIGRCQKNDRKAQQMLYKKYAPGLLGMCIRFTGNRAEAEDVLQEAFVKIFLNLDHYRGTSSLAAWMRKIVINTAITLYHRNKKHKNLIDLDDIMDKMSGNLNISDLEFTREEILNVIHDLSPGYRMVFNLYAMEGFKHKEIAKEMGIDINTSKSQYSRAKKIIQRRLMKMKGDK